MNIIFLDIDGPVISEPQYYIDPECSINRTVVNTSAIGWLNYLCRNCDSKIVTNSSHNYVEGNDTRGTLKEDLIKHGIPEQFFHENWRTRYPGTSGDHRRLDAILIWIEENKGDEEVNWIAFDDDPFTTDKRLCLVRFSEGIVYSTFLKAHRLLAGKDYD